VTDGGTIYLGIIAFATVMMALLQVGAVIYLIRVAKRVTTLVERVERDVAPLVDQLRAVTHEANRAASLAVAQLERADRLFATFSARADETMGLVQQSIVRPLREGTAIVAGIRAGLAAIKEVWGPRRPVHQGVEEEDALFIG
jgi:hypothetical protein